MVVPQKGGIRDEWQRVRVSAVASAVIGGTPSRRVAEYWRGTIPWVTAKDIANTSGRYVEQAHEYITEKGLKSSSAKRMPEGTVIITARGTVGALAQLRQDMAFNQTCYALVPHDGLDNDFLFYALKGTADAMRVLNYGTVFETITTRTFSQWQIPLPPLPEQRAIAHLLGTLDDKIALNRRMNATLDEMARALFTSWFINFDPVQAKAALTQRASPGGSAWPVARARAYLDRLEPALAALFPDRFVDSALGPIPAGWTVKPLDEIAVFRNGLALQQYRPQQDEDRLPVVKIAQLRSGTADSGEWATAKLAPDCVIDDGDIIFSWSGSLLVQVWYGGRAALNQHLFKVTSPRFPQWFLLPCLRGHLAAFQAIAAGKATTMGHIKRQHLSEALCAVPEERLLMAANGLLSAIFEKNISVAVQSRTLAALRDTLLPKLLSGQIRVHAGSPPS